MSHPVGEVAQAVQRLTEALVPQLRAILIELRRLNDRGERFTQEVHDLLAEAKNDNESGGPA